MKFKQLLADKTKLREDILPASYQILGDVLLVKLLDKKAIAKKKEIGSAILQIFPYIKTVCLQFGVRGEFRQPKVEVIAGDKNTETIHRELNCQFKLDTAKIMWSKGNHAERLHMIHSVKLDEIIADMFAGVGYWSICIAKHAKAKQIFAIEKNPVSFRYLQENIRLNRVANVAPLLGDCRTKTKGLPLADRILMGYFPGTLKFLPSALKIAKKGTIIHFHEISSDLEKLKASLKNFPVKIKATRMIKEYSPSKRHYVLDLLVI